MATLVTATLPVVLMAIGVPGQTGVPAPWQVRYAQHTDQTPEWTAAGYTPSWRITWTDAERPEVTWQDDEEGSYRGWLFIGRPLMAPDPPPMAISASFEYVTHCDLDPPRLERSGEVVAFVMTGEAWDALATDAVAASVLDRYNTPGLLLFGVAHGQGADVHEWRDSGGIELRKLSRTITAGERLWVGVAWSGLHFGTDEWGGFRNFEITMASAEDVARRFWDAFDLARPELADLRSAVEARDDAAATAALAAHLRRREQPAVANPPGPADDRTVARADEVLAGTYRLVGCPTYTFPGDIVWNADPFNYDQWAIALNRHYQWRTLASAYLKTRDESYAAQWQDQLNSWVDAMPVFIGRRWIQGPYNQRGRAPLSLDAGIRLGQTWFQSFAAFRRSPSVTDETLVRFARSCWEHALYLMREENFKRGSNWGAMECNGLYHIGVMLPELREARTWRETAVQRLTAELDYQVYPDGAQTELSPGYHGVSLRNFLGVLNLASANGQELPADFTGRLEAMYDYYLKIAMPNLRTPALNDSSRGGIQGYFRDAVKLFPEREEFRWALSYRGEGAPPEYLSVAMPYAGWVMMRTGWEPDASYLLFDAGPFGTGHQHEDKLSIIVYGHGRELLADAGNYAYDTSQWRRYVLSTRAHSTVRVDGKDQNCRSDRGEYRAAEPDTHGFVTNEHFDYARDTHT
ncbi:MAG: alginate lyase family protein, partial [Armatimonadota bacterium]